LTDIPVTPEMAQIFIEESQKSSQIRPYYYDYSTFGRLAFLRLKVTMHQFKDMVNRSNAPTVPEIFGTIDGFEVYGDRNKEFLLYKQKSMGAKNVIRRRKKEPVTTQPDANQTENQPV